jgi:hypothetical protein
MSSLFFRNILCSDWNSADCHRNNDRLIWKLSTSNFCTGVLDVIQEKLIQVYYRPMHLGKRVGIPIGEKLHSIWYRNMQLVSMDKVMNGTLFVGRLFALLGFSTER